MMEKIARFQIQAGDYDRARSVSVLLSRYAESSGFILDRILAKQILARLSYAEGDGELALSLYKELSVLHEQQSREQKAIQTNLRRALRKPTGRS